MLNLQDPFQARKWLRLIRPDRACGFRMIPNLSIPRKYLGFSIQSNGLGLRGPAATVPRNVIFGTSFAMGQAVDVGENWYDLLPLGDDWVNLGLPVGIKQWARLQQAHAAAADRTAVVIYHPNIWPHCAIYRRWERSGVDVFEAFRWKTSFWSCLRLAGKFALKKQRGLAKGNWIRLPAAGQTYEVDCLYSFFDPQDDPTIFDEGITLLNTFLGRFKHSYIIRIPCKTEPVPAAFQTQKWFAILDNYNLMWNRTVAALNPTIKALDWRDRFEMKHYHAFDTHWNPAGNILFAEMLRHILN
jgi:hypothetical protein